jgi:N-acetylneuraminic acid mutarotase
MRKFLFLIALLAILCSAIFVYAAPWTTVAALPAARAGGAYVSDGTYLYYLGGGLDYNDAILTSTVYQYDPSDDSWSTLASLPSALGQIDAAYIDGKIYIPGGYAGSGANSDTLHIYDISTDSWSTGADVPFTGGLEGYSVEVYNGKLYMFGGYDYASFGWVSVVYAYDPGTDNWETLADMTAGGWEVAVWNYDSKMYAAGGNSGAGYTDLAEVYDIGADSWNDAAMADMSAVAMGGADAVAQVGGEGVLFYIGGEDDSGNMYATVNAYNVAANNWSASTALSAENSYGEADCLDGKIYFAGGIDSVDAPQTTHLVMDTGGICSHQPVDDDATDDTAADDTTTDDDAADDVTDDAADDAADDTTPTGGDDDDDDDGGCCGC